MPTVLIREQRCILVPVASVTIIDQIIERHAWFLNDTEVGRYLRIKDSSIEYQRNLLLSTMDSANKIAWAILIGTAEGEIDINVIGPRYIGLATLWGIDRNDLTAHSGLMIGEKTLWNRGFGTDAKLLQLHYAFTVMGLRWVYSRAARSNIACIRMLEVTGYIQQGLRPQCRLIENSYQDELLFGVNREQWRTIWNLRALEPI